MRATLFALLFASLLASTSQAAAIWKVSGEQDFYLFGTIHLLKPEAFPLPSVYDQTLGQCDRLWLEVDTAELADQSLLTQVQQMMMLPAGQRLQDQLSETSYAELEILADQAGISLNQLQRFKPWAAVNQLTLIIFQQKGFTGEGLDPYLHRQAQQKNIPIRAFETLLWQLDMFDRLSAQVGDNFVEFSTEDTENVDQLVDDLYENWRLGDYQTMYRQAAFENYPLVEQIMLNDRNDDWMKALLSTEAAAGTQCVAVGMLHMAGKKGLIAQFEAAGYRVTQVKE